MRVNEVDDRTHTGHSKCSLSSPMTTSDTYELFTLVYSLVILILLCRCYTVKAWSRLPRLCCKRQLSPGYGLRFPSQASFVGQRSRCGQRWRLEVRISSSDVSADPEGGDRGRDRRTPICGRAGLHSVLLCRRVAGCAECIRRFGCICREPTGALAGFCRLWQALLDPAPGACLTCLLTLWGTQQI